MSTLELEHIKHADLASGNNISLTSAGNVGVGAAPVAGDFEVHCASGGELRVDNYGASGVLIKQLNGGSGTSGSMMMQGGTSIILATNDTNEAMRINSSGNVGIGSSSPVRQLEIKDDGTRGQAIVGIIADAGDPAGIFMGTTSNNNAGGIRYFTDTNKLTLRANDEDRLLIDSAGRVTKPYQPAFGANASYTNIPLSGHVVMSLSERFDVGGNLTSNTFTAPVTGKYLITYHVYFTQVDASHNNLGINITTSNKTYEAWWQPNNLLGGDGIFSVSGSQVCDMDINDTMQYKLYTSGGTAQTDIHGDSTVSGCLIC